MGFGMRPRCRRIFHSCPLSMAKNKEMNIKPLSPRHYKYHGTGTSFACNRQTLIVKPRDGRYHTLQNNDTSKHSRVAQTQTWPFVTCLPALLLNQLCGCSEGATWLDKDIYTRQLVKSSYRHHGQRKVLSHLNTLCSPV